MGKHKNQRQEEAMIKFMEDHQDIAKGFTKGDKIEIESLWKNLTKDLNSLGPPYKDTNGWKKVWCYWKSSVKKKLAYNKKESRATGGGPYTQQYISPKETVIGQICGLHTIVEGIQKASSFGADNSDNEVSSSDEEESLNDRATTSTSTPVGRKRIRDDNEDLEDHASTSIETPVQYKKKSDSLKDHLKEYIGSDMKSGKELSAFLKVMTEILNQTTDKLNEIASNTEKLSEISSNIRRVYKTVENVASNLTNELERHHKEVERHHKEMEKAAYAKNVLKEKTLQIQKKQYELDELKNSFKKN